VLIDGFQETDRIGKRKFAIPRLTYLVNAPVRGMLAGDHLIAIIWLFAISVVRRDDRASRFSIRSGQAVGRWLRNLSHLRHSPSRQLRQRNPASPHGNRTYRSHD
jgi:hypothetical protein